MDKLTFKKDFSDDLKDILPSKRQQVLKEIGNYWVEAILADVGGQRSPVNGHQFKRLTSEYAKQKADESSSPVANLELSGKMLDSLQFRIIGNTVEVGIWGAEADKADGHNNFSGKSKLPTRQFIPKKGQNFRPEIRTETDRIIDEHLERLNSGRVFGGAR